MNRLPLPRLSRAQAQSQNHLAVGYERHFMLADEPGVLRLCADSGAPLSRASHWHAAAGHFSLDDADALLNLLSQSPLPVAAAEPADSWQWALWQQYLSPELRPLFAELQPAARPVAAEVSACLLLTLGANHARSRLRLSHQQLTRWLSQPGWRRCRVPLPDSLPLTQPLRLARITLSAQQLRALTAGDLLVPPEADFTPQGTGTLKLGGLRLQGELQLPHHFLIHSLEETPLNTWTGDEPLYDASQMQPDDPTFAAQAASPFTEQPPSAYDEALTPYRALDSLPLTLEVRCGRTVITLAELQQLQPGSVVTLDNVTPGEAGLYHGATLIARGELVDVEGHLGLQLTQMLLRPAGEPQ